MLQLSFESMLRAIDAAVSAEFEEKGGIDHRAVLITPDANQSPAELGG
ncbi:hypothetical protein [Bosea lupini]|nr:hypothetical protein [Bosea lupini]